jgi:hypothetical protein
VVSVSGTVVPAVGGAVADYHVFATGRSEKGAAVRVAETLPPARPRIGQEG